MLKNYISIMRGAALAALLMCGASLTAQTTAYGRDQWHADQQERDLNPV